MPEPTLYLSRFQRKILWHLSQGYTVRGAAEAMGTSRQSVVDSGTIIRRKLDSATNAQAVLTAYRLGFIGPSPDCGTRASYVRHLDAEDDACPACRRANMIWLKSQSEDPPEPRPLTEVQLRIIRAFHCGRTHADLQVLWGVSRGKLHRAVTDMYARLEVSGVPRELRRESALQVAQERGLLNPDGPRSAPPVRSPGKHLTARQKEILSAVAGGDSLARAGAVVGLPRTTLSSRLTEIYHKLGVSHLPRNEKRSAAIREARARGYAI